MRGLPFMPLDVVRLLDSDLFALTSGDEFKAALSLWCKAWLQVPAASLPNDDRVLAHLSGAGARWRKVKDMALRGWQLCSDDRLYHPVIAEKKPLRRGTNVLPIASAEAMKLSVFAGTAKSTSGCAISCVNSGSHTPITRRWKRFEPRCKTPN
ncbi:YdaU family protein [Pseudomonas aeruginosa]|uniref:YdaU family protein n=1 Tax=Pseudomonas aeruginosa TaxID=287 RepID=UPI0021F1142C|nr:YdaU family protein [Pseudomonas aeruginosa]UYM61329.1 YdaU family protein [Pseudomonas aeruginosa]